jgi:hypothetical protein
VLEMELRGQEQEMAKQQTVIQEGLTRSSEWGDQFTREFKFDLRYMMIPMNRITNTLVDFNETNGLGASNVNSDKLDRFNLEFSHLKPRTQEEVNAAASASGEADPIAKDANSSKI